jgi:hypothetical protein
VIGRRTVGGLACLASAAALGACGDGGGSASQTATGHPQPHAGQANPTAASAFAARADGVCLQGSAALVTANGAAQENQIAVQEVARLRALTPPAAIRQDYSSFVDLRARRLAARQAVLAAINAKDDAGYYRNRAEYRRLLPLAYAAASRAGLQDCAGKLPAGDVSAISTLLRREEAHPQASDCRNSLTRQFVTDHYRDLATCERELPRAAAAGVRVAEIRGTLPFATAQVTESGGNAPARTQEFTLLKVDGGWRIHRIRALQPGSLTP